jgi:hypothetical protein
MRRGGQSHASSRRHRWSCHHCGCRTIICAVPSSLSPANRTHSSPPPASAPQPPSLPPLPPPQVLLSYQAGANALLASLRTGSWGAQDASFYAAATLAPLLLITHLDVKLGLLGLAVLGLLLEGSCQVPGACLCGCGGGGGVCAGADQVPSPLPPPPPRPACAACKQQPRQHRLHPCVSHDHALAPPRPRGSPQGLAAWRWGLRYLLFGAAAAFGWWRLHVRSEGRRQLERMQRELNHNIAAFLEVSEGPCPALLPEPRGGHCRCLLCPLHPEPQHKAAASPTQPAPAGTCISVSDTCVAGTRDATHPRRVLVVTARPGVLEVTARRGMSARLSTRRLLRCTRSCREPRGT